MYEEFKQLALEDAKEGYRWVKWALGSAQEVGEDSSVSLLLEL
jgi:hypothetical protein